MHGREQLGQLHQEVQDRHALQHLQPEVSGGGSQDASAGSSITSTEEDSCAFVEFDAVGAEDSVRLAPTASQNSGFESTQDSANPVPPPTATSAAAADECADAPSSAALYRSSQSSSSHRRVSDARDGGSASKSDPQAAAAAATGCRDRGVETELASSDVARSSSSSSNSSSLLELADYFASDRMCEITPCWLYEERSACAVHADVVACPMLLFCLQVMDEFVARNAFQRQEPWRVAACKLAQSVLVARWNAHLLNVGGSQEIALQDFVQRKAALAGVSYEVWRIVAAYWDRYKQSYLHHEELYSADTRRAEHTGHTGGPQSSKWSVMREYAHVYGMQLAQAARLAGDVGASGGVVVGDYLSTKPLADLVASSSRTSPLRFGVAYLQNEVQWKSARKPSPRLAPPAPPRVITSSVRRHVVSQPEWKIAFNAVVIHLQKWDPQLHVFPCGAFSRGAAYGSTIDILVTVSPEAPGRTRRHRASTTLRYDEVVGALASAKVVQRSQEHRVAPTRSLFAVPFKKVSLILDLKVFEQPKSWFALVYFTGPQSFVCEFFSALLRVSSLRELSEPTFDAVFGKAAEVLGDDALACVESEKDVFALAGREYILPAFRR